MLQTNYCIPAKASTFLTKRALHHLLLNLRQAREDALHVLDLDRLALGEDDLEHAPVRGQLALEMLDETVHLPPPEAGSVELSSPVDLASMR